MKSFRPITLILFGSLLTMSFVILGCFIVDSFFQPVQLEAYFILPLIAFAGTFLCFYILISSYLNARLRLIYRKILTHKSANASKANLTEDVVGDLEKVTEDWARDKQLELSKLKEQEVFRREFLGNISHELKTPIFSIQGYILTLLEGGLEDEEVNRKFLMRASKGVDRITHILDDLDTITKLESSELETKFKKFDLTELAEEIIDDLQIKAKQKNVTLKKVWKQNEIYVNADKGKIGQVLTNLISNSIHYGNEAGTTEIRIIKMLDVVTVEVADNGPGIDEEHKSRLFERFYRVDQSRARNEGGTGLGLAIVKHIIDSHNQAVSVRSTVGEGSTFTFTLEKG